MMGDRNRMFDWCGLRRLSLILGWAAMAIAAAACSETPTGTTTPKQDIWQIVHPDTADLGAPLSDGADGEEFADLQGDDTAAVDPDVLEEVNTGSCEAIGGFGCECTKNIDCDSGYCVESAAGKVCTKTCQTDCPGKWKCLLPDPNDPTYICMPPNSTVCKPCTTHKDCASLGQTSGESLCIPFDQGNGLINGQFCGAPCSDKQPCDGGYSCKDVTVPGRDKPVKQCVPDSGDCTCTASWVALQLSTDCARMNEFGSCMSVRTCTPEGLTLCNSAWPAAELCNNIDDDCDGQTDEGDAVGCVVYYADNDGDSYGQGIGQCMCGNPGPGYASVGGDCDDLNFSIHPFAKEICDNVDNDCNAQVDEAGASGCTVYYKDLDGDKFGDDTNSACLCKSKKGAEWMEMPGDCDDSDDKIHPGAEEICNQKDDNCNGKTDEEGAGGCMLYYVDLDKDTYGPSATGKCLCASTKIYPASEPGDCDDNEPKVHPNANEICNNVDDDCNGLTDDGDSAVASCPDIVNATKGCNAGKCGIAGCKKPLFDVNNDPADGCECVADNNYGVHGMTCQNFIDLGQLSDGGGATIIKTGNVMPGEAGDWYHFDATDSPDDGGDCDQFDVRVKLTNNPGNQFAFDFYRGSCAEVNQLCSGETETEWTTSFYGATPSGPGILPQIGLFGDNSKSPNPEKGGECKCTHAPGAPGMNICKNNSAPFLVHVYRKAGLQTTCDAYTITFINAPPL